MESDGSVSTFIEAISHVQAKFKGHEQACALEHWHFVKLYE